MLLDYLYLRVIAVGLIFWVINMSRNKTMSLLKDKLITDRVRGPMEPSYLCYLAKLHMALTANLRAN